MLDYDSKVSTDVLSPEVLLFAPWEDILGIGKLRDTVHKKALQDTDCGPCKKLLHCEEFVVLGVFVYLW